LPLIDRAPARYYGANATSVGPTASPNERELRLKKHGLKETEAGITMKLQRGTFAATFFLACLAAMELEGVGLDEI
jgi:Domain of unknown function (DUF6471)